MATRSDISAETVRQLLAYDPETGALTWKPRTPERFASEYRTAECECETWNKKFAGKRAGWLKPNGYRCITLDYRIYREHHIVWLFVTGALPKAHIDHRNGDRADNRISNLREATNAQNRENMKRSSRNTSGFTGVSWHSQCGKWVAYISKNNVRHCLGLYSDPRDAHAAYLAAKTSLHSFQPVPRE